SASIALSHILSTALLLIILFLWSILVYLSSLLFSIFRRQPRPTRFPYTTLFRSMHALYEAAGVSAEPTAVLACLESGPHVAFFIDRKSTRLNSSHGSISYAGF